MDRRGFLFRALHGMIAGGGALSLSGCGTLMHKERINRPHSRDIDWKVVALNGLGLCFFFVPGVIAFVVDFYTGAIYLPQESCGDGVPMGEPMPVYESMPTPTAEPGPQASIERVGDTTFKRIALGKQQLTREEIEQQVTRCVGRDVTLDADDVRMSRLNGLEEYATVERQHRRDPLFGAPPLRMFGQGWAA
jgi:hypothetical protein